MAPPKALDATHAVYALSTDGHNYRYVGFTGSYGIRKRMAMHRWEARHGNDKPLYVWMREEGPINVIATVLEKMPTDSTVKQLGEREAYWIYRLRGESYDLVNQASGGLGAPGLTLSAERRAALAEKARRETHLHTPENRAKRAAAHVGIKHKPHVFRDIQTQVVSGGRAAHNRWHVARGITKESCMFCKEIT
jgi:hypothetical protein